MKPFLLIAGPGYYPDQGTGDWKGCFATREEAEAQVSVIENRMYDNLPSYRLIGEPEWSHHDWYTIVDLREWMNK